MPELAEVKIFTDQLTAKYSGQTLHKVEVVGGRYWRMEQPNLVWKDYFPLTNARFNAKGKFIYWTFNSNDPYICSNPKNEIYFFITLGMTGSFGKQNKHSAIKFTFDSGELFFNDIRRFGTFRAETRFQNLIDKLNSLGWDCLIEPNVPSNILTKIRKKNKTIAEVLMDQKIFAGLGNYLKNEILYENAIHPNKMVYQLTDQQLLNCCKSYSDIAHKAYKHGGATIKTYSDLYGIAGEFYKQFKVYGQKTDPDGHKVIKLVTADKRTSHIVPEIQTL